VVAAGVGAGVMMAQDRRTSGAYIDDEAIENKASGIIDRQYKNTVHVNVTSFNRNVLIGGECPARQRKRNRQTCCRRRNVRNVSNELVVPAPVR
jgi:osmotically-inducible protein OsmY